MASKIAPSRRAKAAGTTEETLPTTAATQAANMHVAALPVDRIDGDRNIRADLGDLSELVASVRQVGVLQPIAVTPTREDRYEVVYGHRRLAAAREAGLTEVPAIVRASVAEDERLVMMIVENIHRRDLSPLEEARAFQSLRDLGQSQRDMVARVRRSQSHISKRLSLLQLTAAARAALDSGGITLDDALTLTKLADHPVQLDEALAAALDPKTYGTVTAQVDRRLRSIEADRTREAAFATLAEQGVHLVDDGNWWQRKEKVIGQGYSQLDIDPEAHAGEPCHAAAVDSTGTVLLVCVHPDRHLEVPKAETEPIRPALAVVPDLESEAGVSVSEDERPIADAMQDAVPDPEIGASPLKVAPPPPPSPEEEQARAEQEAERAERERHRAEAEAARERRVESMRALVQGKVSRTRALDFVLRQLVSAALGDHGEVQVCGLLDIEPATSGGWAPDDGPYAIERYADRSADRLLRAALAVALVHGDPSGHRAELAEVVTLDEVQRHYRFLTDNGYELAPAEADALAIAAAENQVQNEARES